MWELKIGVKRQRGEFGDIGLQAFLAATAREK
jgi:hypothetical protein